MRSIGVAVLALALVLPAALAAEVVLRPYDPATAQRPVERAAGATGLLAEKLDPPAAALVVPLYEVDTTDPSGTTTLFAARNLTNAPMALVVRYLNATADVVREDLLNLAARETLTTNVRDVAGLPTGPGGFARGYVALVVDDPPGAQLVGDYLQVDVGDDFATGDRMFNLADLCEEAEIRFFDFGDGTDLRVLINSPQGDDPMVDPPSFTVRVLGEDGASFPMTSVFTDQNALSLTAADFTGLAFGTLVFDFTNSNDGVVFGKYSADGRFSVGFNGACIVP